MTGVPKGAKGPSAISRPRRPHDDPFPCRVKAVLGPTNTGKTHLAIERMLAHSSGMIGFPLRLLARENYDRMVARKGAAHVALITGEEKIVPPGARWFSCTVEAMPLDRRTEFLAIDEIQLCADPDRGHVFTDRLLHARGLVETLFLGAETIRPLMQRLVPGIEIETRPRLSNLVFTGAAKLMKLPPRTAIVAFSAAEVYAIAELVRRRRGGCAVVMGQLSPRTRNAQVELYENKEVDYLVATDAIGMGLNMDVNHVAFAGTSKFDGTRVRDLEAPEIAQIAGRAGRGMRDGSFGSTGDCPDMSEALVEAVETHRFNPLDQIFWRNSDLDFTNPETLLASLTRPPPMRGLTPGRQASDIATLTMLASDEQVRAAAGSRARTRLLWEACQIPDFRKIGDDSHLRLCSRIFFHLIHEGAVPPALLDAQIRALDRSDGEIDTLMQRLSGVRVWSYIAARSEWVREAALWQERTRCVEDMLSDVLHERLLARFVDRRATSLLRRLGDDDAEPLLSAVTASGDIVVEGHAVGRIEGFSFVPDIQAGAEEHKLMLRAGRRALRQELPRRVALLQAAPDTALSLSLPRAHLAWDGVAIGRVRAGASLYRPDITVEDMGFLEPTQKDKVRTRLMAFVEAQITTELAPLHALRHARLEDASLRGIAHRLVEDCGITIMTADDHSLGRDLRATLRRLGVHFGRHAIFMPALLRPRPMQFRAMLLERHHTDAMPALPVPGRVSVPMFQQGAAMMQRLGWVRAGPIWLRLDIAERIAADLVWATRRHPIVVPSNLASRLGVPADQVAAVLKAMGVALSPAQAPSASLFGPPHPTLITGNDRNSAARRRTETKTRQRPESPCTTEKTRPAARSINPDSPFAALSRWGQEVTS